MVGLWPRVLSLLACLTGCLAIQSPAAAEWPSWVDAARGAATSAVTSMAKTIDAVAKNPPNLTAMAKEAEKTLEKAVSAVTKEVKTIDANVKALAKQPPLFFKKAPTRATEENAGQKLSRSLPTVPPKPKPIFSDVADLDFEPDRLAQVERKEESSDWAVASDSMPSINGTWTDPPMHNHNPLGPWPYTPKGEPCKPSEYTTLNDLKPGHWQQYHNALVAFKEVFHAECKIQENFYECDPIRDIMTNYAHALKSSFTPSNLYNPIQKVLFDQTQFVVKLQAYSNDAPVDELWESIKKEHHTLITLHSLKQEESPLATMGLNDEDTEEMMKYTDYDRDGGWSFNNLRDTLCAATLMTFMPLEESKRCSQRVSYQEKINMGKMFTWLGMYHSVPHDQHFIHPKGLMRLVIGSDE